MITYTTQRKSEPDKPPRQDPNAAVTSGMQPNVHWYLGRCQKDVLPGPVRDVITVSGKPCARFVTSVESSQNQRPMIKGDVDQTNGCDLLSPVGASCRDCQMGCSPRQHLTSVCPHCPHASANGAVKPCRTSWLSFTSKLQRKSAVNFEYGRDFSKTGGTKCVCKFGVL